MNRWYDTYSFIGRNNRSTNNTMNRFNTERWHFVIGMVIVNMYDTETIQPQTKYRRTVDIMAAILKVVIGGEGTKRGIENGAKFVLATSQTILAVAIEY